MQATRFIQDQLLHRVNCSTDAHQIPEDSIMELCVLGYLAYINRLISASLDPALFYVHYNDAALSDEAIAGSLLHDANAGSQ